jgi:hypothetical protein
MTIFLKDPLAAYASSTFIAFDRVGEISNDRSAVVGHDGWCFIYDGSNNYRDAYHDKQLAPLGDQWVRLIEQRQRKCEALGVRFVQLIVPNKATLMPENFPEPIGAGITTVLERLLKAELSANLLCPVVQMRQQDLRESIFRRNDSHLTIAGNAFLAELVLSAVGITLPRVPFIEICRVDHTGDLGSKFTVPISETLCAPRFETGLLDQSKIQKTHEIVQDGFNGTQQSFYNSYAPIKQTLLIFGNSFFERSPSWGLSPLFCSLFERIHFVWTPLFDEDLINKIKPNIVIAQTCERFLNKVPSA